MTVLKRLAREMKVEFVVKEQGGKVLDLAEFGSMITSLAQGEDPVRLAAFSEFLNDAEGHFADSGVSWNYMDDSGAFIAMQRLTSYELEGMFGSDPSSTSFLSLFSHPSPFEESRYVYDFQQITQTNIATKEVREIRSTKRPTRSSTWTDY